MAATQIPRVKLGTQGFEVSKLGFGCMGLSGAYNDPVAEEDGISIIKYAFSKGITFFDTADVYGAGANEVLVGKALKQLPREKIQLATKFGILRRDLSGISIQGSPDYVRSCIEASLKRLDVEYIDLYYQHRVDKSVPIEETVKDFFFEKPINDFKHSELKKLVEEGKIRYIGLSEASPDTIRRAHAVHPITAVQIEWSLWTRDIEEEIVPLCRELGIGIVPYSPLGRGFFGGKGVVENVPAVSSLTAHPRFQGENLDKNKNIYDRIESLAKKHQATPAQLALAWVLQQGEDVVPIPGSAQSVVSADNALYKSCQPDASLSAFQRTTKIKNLDQNLGALGVKLSEKDLREISEAVPIDDVAGGRYYSGFDQFSWKFANTPPKDSRV
ncbi:NADP-dependent oxidoreductase domain [Sesbania bispinosa]|nr:NADP-dependent oxidoreductase domain [Sesbania bispinosa]